MSLGDHRGNILTSDFLRPGWEKLREVVKEGSEGKTGCRAESSGGLKREVGM